MVRIISAVSGKGGAGKTTAAILVAGELALEGKSVLMIDADARRNLTEWWERSIQKHNRPANVSMVVAARRESLNEAIDHAAGQSDFIVIDAPGVDSSLISAVLERSELIMTPVQPNQDEIKAVGEAAELAASVGDTLGRAIPQAIFRTRITVPNRNLAEYRIIRQFSEKLEQSGYDSVLLETELTERNCYREIRSGLGTLQMLDLTEPVKKGRVETKAFVQELLNVPSVISERNQNG
ncbi:ParA family protein (plasmid) [Agrobacterium sp. 13-2099-1-2]|uniref:ParA family protein n=1 Tax=Agrobacterium sp. 13-2099-1-2 TaxID=1841651 RepID=UPI00080F8B70|nr:ParA family protein [Agrobacterium sp. 13-2099-1-2]UZX45518.1 ParA family protein [Agrobacterium sp. 13-2099-1-2]